MKVIDISIEIFKELSEPSDISVAAISFWIRSNVGSLNNLIGTEYTLNAESLYEFSPDIGEREKSILKKMYAIYYYGKKVLSNLGAAASSSLLEVTSDGATVRQINKNEISKTYLALKNNEQEDLDKLVFGYKGDAVSPLQVTGDDNIPASEIQTLPIRTH